MTTLSNGPAVSVERPRPSTGMAERPPQRRRRFTRRSLIPWLFLVPGLLLGVIFKFGPMIEGIRMSFVKVQPFLGDEFIGLDNYVKVLSDQRFLDALAHTVVLGGGQAIGALILGTGLALLLEGSSRRLWFVRTAVFLPVVTAVAVVGEIWRILLFPTESGFINSILGMVGIQAQGFLSDPNTSLGYVMAVGIWISAPYNMVIILAGLAGIDRALYESAAVDGVTTWQRLRYIVFPALRPALSVVLTLAAIRSLRIFTEVFVLTGGGPAGSTEVWMTRVFSLGFKGNDLGVASAASVLLLVATLVLTVSVRMVSNRKERAR
ncbi:carbohydrate ABC transporter membrane protein 1, CUT1 family [Agreia bicolorata]|uniref:Carbohydrate ABC transporter membrane protein 1, CUT1 family n=1 Tax=Agreia bicolorata TaxID=110935 RepID=A0A1T4XIT9_9MICO|nr:sugar ABC transporter permease [Agreia bicolorata]KJC64965.1 sugar ABC transporter permease [Agreia bicolorata]SKA89396.1 carbohydrate ABC transporter membrane protein 1, CUT1 family [Agreia bicolorata]